MKLPASATFLFIAAVLFALPALRAEDTANEASEAADEQKAADALPGETPSPLKGLNFKGIFTAQTSDEEKPAIVGLFKTEKTTYLVKPDSDDVRDKLKAVNGKEVILYGKERNKGKYLIVMTVVGEPDPIVNKRKKKGF
ncbi:MAG TPA: hypothetical protein VKX17_22180 [Planctomycetota bacterium]|nr:hypothetical protein [Planctomycetota bacterium]